MGLSIATLLSQNHEVMAVDIVPEKWRRLIKESVRYRMNTSKNT